jgi:hypothetical protein
MMMKKLDAFDLPNSSLKLRNKNQSLSMASHMQQMSNLPSVEQILPADVTRDKMNEDLKTITPTLFNKETSPEKRVERLH